MEFIFTPIRENSYEAVPIKISSSGIFEKKKIKTLEHNDSTQLYLGKLEFFFSGNLMYITATARQSIAILSQCYACKLRSLQASQMR